MTQRRSILDRSDLYWPAPKLSGQASYGGVLRSVFYVAGGALLSSAGLVVVIIVALISFGYEGSTKWVWLAVPIITFFITVFMLRWTQNRRDILVVLWEARKIEQKERRA